MLTARRSGALLALDAMIVDLDWKEASTAIHSLENQDEVGSTELME